MSSIDGAAFAAMSLISTAALQGLQRAQEVIDVEEAQQLPQEVGAVEGAGDHAAVRIDDESQPASQMEVVLS